MDDDFIQTYIRYQREKRDEDFWAWETLDDLVLEDPQQAWAAIVKIIQRTNDRPTLAALGAGGLENLLWRHSALIEKRVLEEATKNEKLRHALSNCIVSEATRSNIRSLLDKFGFRKD